LLRARARLNSDRICNESPATNYSPANNDASVVNSEQNAPKSLRILGKIKNYQSVVVREKGKPVLTKIELSCLVNAALIFQRAVEKDKKLVGDREVC
jgi:hypothetical protein